MREDVQSNEVISRIYFGGNELGIRWLENEGGRRRFQKGRGEGRGEVDMGLAVRRLGGREGSGYIRVTPLFDTT